MAAGKISIQANDGKVAGVVFEDGASSNVTVTIPKEGGVLATQSGLDTAMSTINASVPAAYHIYNGQLALANTVITTGFSTTLYTGNGTSQSITTGVDMDTQWGNDASEKLGGLVWLKSRSIVKDNVLADTIRGVNNVVYSNATLAQDTTIGTITAFNNNGFSLGSNVYPNTNLATYASWNFQTTYRVSGTTNHGKAYTCHYNPFTGFTMVKYEGSGLAGHEIPHFLGRKLGFYIAKNISTASTNWVSLVTIDANNASYIELNTTLAKTDYSYFGCDDVYARWNDAVITRNASANTYIIYGWANSYFDEKNTLIGNYEIGVYQGTGAAGNKVTTRGKPAWIMIKRTDSASDWLIYDSLRNNISGVNDGQLYSNLASAEVTNADILSFNADGFTFNAGATIVNASGGQYLYMVVYDNDSGSGKSKYPRATDTSTLNLNAHVPFANGIDTTGSKVSIAYKNETITLSNALVQGKNYIALLNDGTYVAKTIKPSYGLINPASGDFFNLDTQKWYSNLNVEITPRNYLDCVVYADQNGQPEYVEQIEKVQYFDVVKANDFRGKNACTAWVNFDGTTTPPTIRDSYNVSAVIRTATGFFDIYFIEEMDSSNYCITVSTAVGSGARDASGILSKYINKVSIQCIGGDSVAYNSSNVNIQIFGGKN